MVDGKVEMLGDFGGGRVGDAIAEWAPCWYQPRPIESILAPYRHFRSSESESSVVALAKSDLLRASPFWRSGAVCSPLSARSNWVLT